MPRGSPAYYALLVAVAGLPLLALFYASLDPAINSIVANTSFLSASENPEYVLTGQQRIMDMWTYFPLVALVSLVFAGILVSRSGA